LASVKTNIVANFAGKGVAALIGLLLVPVYIRYLGIEAYGLVGLFALLTALSMILDLGVSPAINRELARLSIRPDAAQEARDLVRTLETFYWGIGVIIGAAVIAAAPLIASRWVQAKALPAGTVQTSIALMGVVLALQWPFSFYEGGLVGLQQLVLYNGIQAALQIVRGLGAVVVLRFISPTIIAFFVWQLAISAAGAAAAAIALWTTMPRGGRPKFSKSAFLRVRGFAAEMTATSAVAMVLMQLDKVVLSRRLSLADFGYYNLAVVAASGLAYLIGPIAGALFPRLSQLVALEDEHGLARAYHAGCQLITVIVAPFALAIAFFSTEVMTIWTRNKTTAAHTALLVTLLVIAGLLNAFVNVPYMLQLAAGWTRLGLYVNTATLFVQVPLLLYLTARYGALGAAIVTLALNASYVLIGVNFMYARLLREHRWRWYLSDIAIPCAAAVAVIVPFRLLLPPLSNAVMLPLLAVIVSLAFAAAVLAAPDSRGALLEMAGNLQRRLIG
jgi:O-antigen/teichoic acid export membrane protein